VGLSSCAIARIGEIRKRLPAKPTRTTRC